MIKTVSGVFQVGKVKNPQTRLRYKSQTKADGNDVLK